MKFHVLIQGIILPSSWRGQGQQRKFSSLRDKLWSLDLRNKTRQCWPLVSDLQFFSPIRWHLIIIGRSLKTFFRFSNHCCSVRRNTLSTRMGLDRVQRMQFFMPSISILATILLQILSPDVLSIDCPAHHIFTISIPVITFMGMSER
jgi:hypothetical protein